MTKEEAGQAILEIMLKCKGTPVAIVALIADENTEDVRVMHPLLDDRMCARLLKVTADQLESGDN